MVRVIKYTLIHGVEEEEPRFQLHRRPQAEIELETNVKKDERTKNKGKS